MMVLSVEFRREEYRGKEEVEQEHELQFSMSRSFRDSELYTSLYWLFILKVSAQSAYSCGEDLI